MSLTHSKSVVIRTVTLLLDQACWLLQLLLHAYIRYIHEYNIKALVFMRWLNVSDRFLLLVLLERFYGHKTFTHWNLKTPDKEAKWAELLYVYRISHIVLHVRKCSGKFFSRIVAESRVAMRFFFKAKRLLRRIFWWLSCLCLFLTYFK